jgi:DNA-binding NarL/FixJ family response regulator
MSTVTSGQPESALRAVHDDGRPAPVIRVLVAVDLPVVRAGFRVLLERDRRITVVADAGTGEEAVDLARRVRPDVVMVDAMLRGPDSVETTRRIRSESGAAVMFLVFSEADELVIAALRAGAGGVLLKDTGAAELVSAVDLLARGETPLASSVTRRLIAELASRPEPECPDPELVGELTAREREVVALVGRGLDNAEIAECLVLSPATAKSHVSHAMLKLGATDRAKLVVFAYESGLVVRREEAPLAA